VIVDIDICTFPPKQQPYDTYSNGWCLCQSTHVCEIALM